MPESVAADAKVKSQMRLPKPLLLASLGVLFAAAACTLITDVDRSKIPDGVGGVPSNNGGDGPQPTAGKSGSENGGTSNGMAGDSPGGSGSGGDLGVGGDAAGGAGGAGDAGGAPVDGGAGGVPSAGAGAGGTP
jgi:hypothetical protein